MSPAGAGRIAILGVDHVQISIPIGGEDAARRFYGGLLGLREVPKPAALQSRGGCWFMSPDGLAIHLGTEEPFRPAARAHPCLVVADLALGRHVLEAAGAPVAEDDAQTGLERLYSADPFGNRLELVSAADRGFSDRGRSDDAHPMRERNAATTG